MSSLKGVRTEMPRDDSRVVKVDHEADQGMASGQKKSGLGGNGTRARTTWYQTGLNKMCYRALSHLSKTCESATNLCQSGHSGQGDRATDRLHSFIHWKTTWL